jgi:transmembrane serine protease 6
MSIATGWGALREGGPSAAKHQEVSMLILTDKRCEEKFDGSNDMLDPLTQVCAGEDNENKDTCQGDSGGPLVVQHDDGNWYLIGLTSWVSDFQFCKVI